MGEYSSATVMNFCIYGGNEQSTHKFISELIGRETIDTNTYGKSVGQSGSYSTNYQNIGRELMTPDEVRMLENDKAILLIRGEKPVIDYKYDILKHPNLKYTADGKAKFYEHGGTERATASLLKVEDDIDTKETIDIKDLGDLKNYEILNQDDIREYFIKEELDNEKNK